MNKDESFELQNLIEKEINLQVEKKIKVRIEEINEYKRSKEEELNLEREKINNNKKKLSEELKNLEKLKDEHFKKINLEKLNLEKAIKQLEIKENAICNSIIDTSAEQFVSINLGGKVFHTLKSTL